MSSKLLWTGLTLIVALPPVLALVGLGAAGAASVIIGAIAMVVGCVLMLLDR